MRDAKSGGLESQRLIVTVIQRANQQNNIHYAYTDVKKAQILRPRPLIQIIIIGSRRNCSLDSAGFVESTDKGLSDRLRRTTLKIFSLEHLH